MRCLIHRSHGLIKRIAKLPREPGEEDDRVQSDLVANIHTSIGYFDAKIFED